MLLHPPHNARYNTLWLRLRGFILAIACSLVLGCSSNTNITQPAQIKPSEGLTKSSLSHLLIGEFSLQRGYNEEATKHLLIAARANQDLDSAKRATYSAQFSQNPDLLTETSKLWSQLAPQDPRPWQYIAQAASINGQFTQATKALNEELKRGGGAGLPYVASLSISHSKASQIEIQDTFESWLHTYPNHKHLLYSLTLLAQASNQHDAAMAYVEKALAQDEHYIQAQVVYGELLLKNQKIEEAHAYLSQYTQPLNQAPTHLIILHAQAFALMDQYQDAYEYFNELTRRYPNDISYRFSAGLLAYENHQYSSAYPHFRQAVKLNPDSHSAYYYLGLSALGENREEQALKYLRLVTKGPDRLNAITRVLDIENPNESKIADYFHQLRHQHPDISADIFGLEAHYLQKRGNLEGAARSYQEAIERQPDHISLLYGYALVAQSLHQFGTSEELLQRIIAIEPNNINALNALGYTYAEQGINLKQAELLIRKALAQQPNNAAIIDSLGWVIYRQGHLRQSLTLLAKAYDILPSAEIAAHLGTVEWALGDTESAFETWNSALTLDPDNPHIKQAILDTQNEFQSD